jgi:hypothetical protein
MFLDVNANKVAVVGDNNGVRGEWVHGAAVLTTR